MTLLNPLIHIKESTMRFALLRWVHVFSFSLITVLVAPTVADAATERPFDATIFFSEQATFSHEDLPPPCLLIGAISGIGVASKIGAIRLVSTDCINPVSPTSFMFSSQQVVLIVAHGDELWATYGGTLSAETGAITGSYLISGGTGRFTNARGAGIITGLEKLDLSTGTGTGKLELNGTLSY